MDTAFDVFGLIFTAVVVTVCVGIFKTGQETEDQ
jgi:hypothetical protein